MGRAIVFIIVIDMMIALQWIWWCRVVLFSQRKWRWKLKRTAYLIPFYYVIDVVMNPADPWKDFYK